VQLVDPRLPNPLPLQILALSAWLLAGACVDRSPREASTRPAGTGLDYRHVQRTYVRAGQQDMHLDLYLPRAASRPVPVVVMFHGGGWVQGLPRQARGELAPFLRAGWAGVTPAYRLAPRDRAPAALEDAECALRWVGVHAAEYGLDRKRILVAGYSAGGYLALMLGISPDSTAFARNCSALPRPPVRMVVNLAGVADLEELLAGGTRRAWAVDWVGPAHELGPFPAAWSPLRSARTGGAPVLTLHGDSDEVVPYSQSVRLHRELDRFGVVNRLVTLHGAGHSLAPSAAQLAQREAATLLEAQGVTPTPAGGRPSSR
jgi:acetyl esterase/lipase